MKDDDLYTFIYFYTECFGTYLKGRSTFPLNQIIASRETVLGNRTGPSNIG